MKEKELKNEGLADLAHKVEKDHEVQMARAELYKIGKYAIKLHEMLKGVSEQEGLEGWVQSKITKAGDYLSSVYHHMDYEQKFEQVQTEAKAKPDFLDMDKDGNKKEPMKKAIKDKEAKKDKKESIDYKEELAEELNRVLSKKKTERSLTKGEEKKKEKYVKGMKKAKGDFKDRYGKDAEAVMYATATKMAKGESVEEGVKRNILYREIGKRLARGQDIDKIKKYYKDIDNKYPGHIEKIVQALKDRNEIPFKVKEEKKNCGCNQDPCITYGKQEDLEEYSFSKREFLDNEAENLHSENAVELAKKFGTPKEIKQMDDILTRHNKRGHITPEDMETRDALVRKYYSMLEGKKEDEDYEAKLKALLKIQMDPNTAKDPELKKELMKRKAKLLKTKESLQNEIEWKLQEKALAEGYEGAIIHALRQEGINSFFNKGTLYIEDNADMERVEEIVNQTVQIPPEIKPEEDYYKVESKQKPYVSMYRDGNNGKMIYDVLDKNGDSVYKTNDKT